MQLYKNDSVWVGLSWYEYRMSYCTNMLQVVVVLCVVIFF